MSRHLPTRYIAILLALIPAVASAQGIGGVAVRAFGAREWREAVAAVVNLPTCDTDSGISSENGVLRYVVAEQALYRCTGGAWGVALSGGAGTDTTCLNAGVDCPFAGSATEGGAATSALDLSCTGCVAASEVAADVATQAELDAVAGAETDDQDGTEVPYTPTTGTDWTDPDPVHVAEGLDDLAGRLVTEEGKADADTFAGYTPTGADLGVVTGTAGGTGICAEWNADGDLVAAASAAACGAGGGSPGFDAITSGTNTTAAMVVSTGALLKVSGTGTIDASGIDADGDGFREVNPTGFDLDDDGANEFSLDIASGYLRLRSLDAASQGMHFLLPFNDEFLFDIGSTRHLDIRTSTGVRVHSRLTIDGLAALTPKATAPATCTIGELYVDTSGAYCACHITNTWWNMTPTGACT